jgi:hypothetical protein
MTSATPTLSYASILTSKLQVDLVGINAQILYQVTEKFNICLFTCTLSNLY